MVRKQTILTERHLIVNAFLTHVTRMHNVLNERYAYALGSFSSIFTKQTKTNSVTSSLFFCRLTTFKRRPFQKEGSIPLKSF